MPLEVINPFFTESFFRLQYSPEISSEPRPLPYASSVYFKVNDSWDVYTEAKNQILSLLRAIQALNADGLSFLSGYVTNIEHHLDGLFHDFDDQKEVALALDVAKKKLETLYANHSEKLAQCEASLASDLTVTACFPGATSNVIMFFYRITATTFENKLALAKRTVLMNLCLNYLKHHSKERYYSISEVHRVNAYFNFAAPFFSLRPVEDKAEYTHLRAEDGPHFIAYLNARPLLLFQALLDELLVKYAALEIPSEKMDETYPQYVDFFGRPDQKLGFFSELPSVLQGIYHDMAGDVTTQRVLSAQERDRLNRLLLIQSLRQLNYMADGCVQENAPYLMTPEHVYHLSEHDVYGVTLPCTREMTVLPDAAVDFHFVGADSSLHLACFSQAEICRANAPELQKLQALLTKQEALTEGTAHWIKAKFDCARSAEKTSLLLHLAMHGGWGAYTRSGLLQLFYLRAVTLWKLSDKGNFVRTALFYACPDVILGMIDMMSDHPSARVSLNDAMASESLSGETLFEVTLRKSELHHIKELFAKQAYVNFLVKYFYERKESITEILFDKLRDNIGTAAFTEVCSVLSAFPGILVACANKAHQFYEDARKKQAASGEAFDASHAKQKGLPFLILGFGQDWQCLDASLQSNIIDFVLEQNYFSLLNALMERHGISINDRIRVNSTPMVRGKTLLQRAIELNNPGAVQFLLKDMNLSVCENDVSVAVKKAGAEIVSALLGRFGINLLEKNKKAFVRELIKHAINRGACDGAVFSCLLDKIDVNMQDSEGETPLTHAVIKGRYTLVHLLLKHPGLIINQKNKKNERPVYIAARDAHGKILSTLLDIPQLVLAEDGAFTGSIFEAIALSGRVSGLEMMVRRSSVPEKLWRDHSRAIFSVLLSHEAFPSILFNCLLRIGCLDPSKIRECIGHLIATWIKGGLPLPFNFFEGMEDRARQVLQLGDVIVEDGETLISHAIFHNHLDAIKCLTQFDDISIEYSDRYGEPLLDRVLSDETDEAVAIHLVEQYPKHFKGWTLEDGTTVLATAIHQEKWGLVEQLVVHDIDLFACAKSAKALYDYGQRQPTCSEKMQAFIDEYRQRESAVHLEGMDPPEEDHVKERRTKRYKKGNTSEVSTDEQKGQPYECATLLSFQEPSTDKRKRSTPSNAQPSGCEDAMSMDTSEDVFDAAV